MSTSSHFKAGNGNLSEFIKAWLNSWEFVGNPFESWDADKEQPQLDRYYVKPPFYEQLLAETKSTLVYAPRGGGKSAARIMLQSECRPFSRSSGVLAVPFTDFSPFAEDFTRVKEYTLRDYLQVILHEALQQLLVAFVVSVRREISLTEEQLRQLLYWLEQYVPQWKSQAYTNGLMNFISRFHARGGILDSQAELFEKQQVLSLLKKLSEVYSIPPPAKIESSSHVMEAFVRFSLELLSSEQFPCHAVHFLVDGLDEYLLTQDDPQAGADLLKPLLGNVRFLEIPGLAVKFFLPIEYRTAFERVTRTDRIPSYTISWSLEEKGDLTQSQMKELLTKRIRHHSRGKFQSLSEMCTPELKHVIEDALLEEAQGIPRRLLQLGNQVFVEHCREAPLSGSEITMEDWERALNWIRGSLPPLARTSTSAKAPEPQKLKGQKKKGPLLHIDLKTGRAYVDDVELPALPDLEFRLLTYLYRRRNEICSREEIIAAVYRDETGITDERLGSLVYRLRNALGETFPNLSKTHFIKTVARRGYLLENAH
jgi:hypothetical protein